MPPKNNYRKRKYNNKRKYIKKKNGLTFEKRVTTIHKKLMDASVEDKYNVDLDYINITDDYEEASFSGFTRIDPTWFQGVTATTYIGNEISVKSLKVECSYIPGKSFNSFAIDPANATWANNIKMGTLPLRMRLVKLNARYSSNNTDARILSAMNIKFLAPGEFKQDTELSEYREDLKNIVLCKSVSMPTRYSNHVGITDTSAVSNVRISVINNPIESHKTINYYKFNGKHIIGEDGRFNTWHYYLFFQAFDERQNHTWTLPTIPDNISYRSLWVFEG